MVQKHVMTPFLRMLEKFYRNGLDFKKRGNKPPYAVNGTRVISIGNITCGGTGKTPLAILLAGQIAAMEKKVAVLTRGYGNDENRELQERLHPVPVLVGKNRVENAKKAVKQHQAEFLVLDDGFQHDALKRDFDIVTVNATNPFGNGHLLPAGTLREPLNALSRANCFVLTQSHLGKHNLAMIRQKLHEHNPNAPIFEADHMPVRFVDFRRSKPLPLEMVRGRRVAVLSGIADPVSFERMVDRLGARVSHVARFDDHHAFRKDELRQVFNAARASRARFVITTSKDSYRLLKVLGSQARHPVRILVLQMEMRIDDEEAFLKKCLPEVFPSN